MEIMVKCELCGKSEGVLYPVPIEQSLLRKFLRLKPYLCEECLRIAHQVYIDNIEKAKKQ